MSIVKIDRTEPTKLPHFSRMTIYWFPLVFLLFFPQTAAGIGRPSMGRTRATITANSENTEYSSLSLISSKQWCRRFRHGRRELNVTH